MSEDRPRNIKFEDYIGDGVYVGFDGEAIILWTEREGYGTHWIALEGSVFSKLEAYRDRLLEIKSHESKQKRCPHPEFTPSYITEEKDGSQAAHKDCVKCGVRLDGDPSVFEDGL